MPKVQSDIPEKLRPYTFHGLRFTEPDASNNVYSDCPWCGREDKFGVGVETGQWRCFVCNEGAESDRAIKGGNALTFIRLLWERSYEATPLEAYRELTRERKYLNVDTLVQWNLARSFLTGDWIVPGYNETGSIHQVYRWIQNGKRRAFYLTPTLGHKLLGVNHYDDSKSKVYLGEGLWDGAAVWEALGQTKETDSLLVPTSNAEVSLLADVNVLCIPTSEVFFDNWLPLFKDKAVYLLCQNDHPRKHPQTGAHIPPASLTGMRRIAKLLAGTTNDINYLHWGEGEEGYDLRRPSGYDCRDLICTG